MKKQSQIILKYVAHATGNWGGNACVTQPNLSSWRFMHESASCSVTSCFKHGFLLELLEVWARPGDAHSQKEQDDGNVRTKPKSRKSDRRNRLHWVFPLPKLLKQSHFSESAGLRVPGSNHKYCLWPLHVLQRIAQRKYLGTTSCAVQAWHLTPPPACWAPAAPLGALRTPSVPAQLIPAQASRASLQLCERKKFQGKSGIEIEVCTQSKAQHCSRSAPGRAQSRGQGSEPICRGSTGRAPAEPRAGSHVRRSRRRSQHSLSRILAWPGEMSPGHRDEQQWARTPALPPGSSSPLQSPKAGKIWDKYLRVRRCSWASGARAEHGGFGVASAKAVAVALFFFFSWTIQMH